MAQHEDLNGEIGVTATDESDDLEGAAERPVEEGKVIAGCCLCLGSTSKCRWQGMDGVFGTDRFTLIAAPTDRQRSLLQLRRLAIQRRPRS